VRKLAFLASALLVLAATGLAIALLREPNRPEARFATLAGPSVSLADLRGKVVLVDFWATDCEICVEEMPSLADSYRRFAPRGYEVVAVALASDHPNRVADFAQKRALPFTVALDLDGSVARAFGEVPVTPTLFLLDKEGRVLRQWRGRTDWRALSARIEKALAS
jgi:peroxiredoxin